MPCPLSDHNAVTAHIQLPNENPRGPGVWKLNNTILSDTNYRHEMNTFLDYWQTQKNAYDTICQWWDALKEHIKRISIQHSTRLALSNNKAKREVRQRIDDLLAQDPTDERIKTAQDSLDLILETEAKGRIIRSRAIWHEQGEKPKRYFFSLEKKKQQQHTITAINTATGRATSDMEILNEAHKFYQDLYHAESTNERTQRDFLAGISRKLMTQDKQICEGEITTAELRNALTTMLNNKSPGKDGLTTEFY